LAAPPLDVRIGKPFARREQTNICNRDFTLGNSDQLTVLKAYKVAEDVLTKSASWETICTENSLSWQRLVTLADIKREFLELLASIGFIPVEIGRINGGNDNILDVTGPELNVNGNNTKLLIAIICAALYPNVVKVETPEKRYAHSGMGTFPIEFRPHDLTFKTRGDDRVYLHLSSVSHCVTHYTIPYLVYHEKVQTCRVFINNCSMVHFLSILVKTKQLNRH
jgi:ATP-dependent RNA helicase DHX57